MRSYVLHLKTTPIKLPGAKTPTTKLPEPSTVNRELEYLRRLLNVGNQLRWISSNPFNEDKPLIGTKVEKVRDRALTYDEEMRLLEACELPDVSLYIRKAKSIKYKHPKTKKWVKYECEEKAITSTMDNARQQMKLIVLLAIGGPLRSKAIFALD